MGVPMAPLHCPWESKFHSNNRPPASFTITLTRQILEKSADATDFFCHFPGQMFQFIDTISL